jgi:uncharacterized membrane protein
MVLETAWHLLALITRILLVKILASTHNRWMLAMTERRLYLVDAETAGS